MKSRPLEETCMEFDEYIGIDTGRIAGKGYGIHL